MLQRSCRTNDHGSVLRLHTLERWTTTIVLSFLRLFSFWCQRPARHRQSVTLHSWPSRTHSRRALAVAIPTSCWCMTQRVAEPLSEQSLFEQCDTPGCSTGAACGVATISSDLDASDSFMIDVLPCGAETSRSINALRRTLQFQALADHCLYSAACPSSPPANNAALIL